MSLTKHLNEVLENLLLKPAEAVSSTQLIPCVDLTLLDQQASKESLLALNDSANSHQVAAVCVFPHDLAHLKLKEHIKIATVVNFPQGNEDVATCLAEIDRARSHGVHEIDYVVPYSLYLEGKKKQALHHAQQIIHYCKEHLLTVKVIMETGAFQKLDILYELASELSELNVDFLKTSTGKIPVGASLAAAFTLLSAIKDSGKNIGLKISGGVKTKAQAQGYAHLSQVILNRSIDSSWFRIGASSLMEELIKN